MVRLKDLEDLARRRVTREERARQSAERRARSPLVSGQIHPRARVDPRYPAVLVAAGVEGWLTVDLGIARDGSVVDPLIVEAKPPYVFERTLLDAVRTWSYEPHEAEGEVRVLVKHIFQLAR